MEVYSPTAESVPAIPGPTRVFFQNLSYRNKLFLAVVALVLLISGMLAFSVWVMILPYLQWQITDRGSQLAQRVAWEARAPLLNGDTVRLTELVFDEKYHEKFVAFIIVLGADHRVLAHTFLGPGAAALNRQANQAAALKLAAQLTPEETINVSREVTEGLNQVGVVLLGLKRSYISAFIRGLNIFNVALITGLTIVGLAFAFYLSRYITRPLASLTGLAERVSQGDLEAARHLRRGPQCWTIMGCSKPDCPAYGATHLRCWFIENTKCGPRGSGRCSDPFPLKLNACRECRVYRLLAGDETDKLLDAFGHMTHNLSGSQNALRLSEMKYRDLFDQSPVAIFVLAQDTLAILDANKWALGQYGLTLDEFQDQTFLNLVEPDQAARVAASLSALDAESGPVLLDQLRQRKKNGEWFYSTVLASHFTATDPGTLIVTSSDITAMVEAQSQTIQAAKLATLGEMSTGVAHELNQPLNAIRVGSDYLGLLASRGEAPGPAELAEVNEVIREQVERAAGIIRHLREFGRQSKVDKQLVDVNQPIRGVFALVGQQTLLRGLRVELDLAGGLPPIWADANRLEQVFMNLVLNARDALAEGAAAGDPRPGIIRVTSGLTDGLVTVSVADNGPGVPEHHREKLFQPFFTTKPVGKGTGLGLSISYGIVREHGGAISLVSPPEGGAVFRLTFPPAEES
ncbi:MAG: PAS domain S-box protein [Deltaproteobacteria bacterium]|nr:PAS domain S-box protein [Deltaproteobacteria bacterium]